MKKSIESAVAVLKGQPLWTCRCTAGLASFQFGPKQACKTFVGKETEVGMYALNVQCPWRITRGERVAVGSGDIYYPADLRVDNTPLGFDSGTEPTRRDKLLESLFEPQTAGFVVHRIVAGSAGWLHLEMDACLSLDVFPDNSLSNEHWRLFKSGATNHFIVTGEGVQE